MKIYSGKVDFKDLSVPLMKTTTADVITAKDDVKNAVLQMITSPIHWVDCKRKILEYDAIIQIGPGTGLADSLKKMDPNKKIVSVNKESDLTLLADIVGDKG